MQVERGQESEGRGKVRQVIEGPLCFFLLVQYGSHGNCDGREVGS